MYVTPSMIAPGWKELLPELGSELDEGRGLCRNGMGRIVIFSGDTYRNAREM